MREHWRAFRLMVSFMFRADRKLAWTTVLLTPINYAAWPAVALGIKFLGDGTVQQQPDKMIVGVLILSLAMGLAWRLESVTYRLMISLAESTTVYGDEQVIQVVGSIPGLEHHERPDYLDTLSLVRSEVDWYQSAVGLLIGSLGQATLIITTLGLLSAIHPVLLLLPLFGIPSLLIMLRSQKRMEQVQRETAEPTRLGAHLFNLAVSAGPAKEIRIFNLREELLNRFRLQLDRTHAPLLRVETTNARMGAVGKMILGVGFGGTVLFVAWQATLGRATAGDVLLAIYLALGVTTQIEGAWWHIRWGRRNVVAAGRLLWLLDYAQEQQLRHPKRARRVPNKIDNGLLIDDVSFAYPGTEGEVLSDIRLEIPAGSTVALVGDNGAGKTTLVKLLCRFYQPTAGRILVDGTDLAEFDLSEWWKRTSTAFEDFCKFEFIARESVGVGSLPRINDPEAVAAAMDKAGAHDLTRSWPSGLETQLGRDWNGGIELSMGQWQKVALSRAVMRDHPLLLILDEPTASLDAETEYALFQRFRQAAGANRERGSITILVSHRFSTVRMADLIAVIDQGRLQEIGSHDELMRVNGLYANLFSIQARSYR
jgi:ATP-binding cassette, subfamily B, bacterial